MDFVDGSKQQSNSYLLRFPDAAKEEKRGSEQGNRIACQHLKWENPAIPAEPGKGEIGALDGDNQEWNEQREC